MKPALQTYTPRSKPLSYDSLRNTFGCQTITGNSYFNSKAFVRVCVE